MPQVLTADDAAQYLQMHRRTITNKLLRGELPGVKTGKEWRIRKEDLDEYLKGSFKSGTSKPQTTDEEANRLFTPEVRDYLERRRRERKAQAEREIPKPALVPEPDVTHIEQRALKAIGFDGTVHAYMDEAANSEDFLEATRQFTDALGEVATPEEQALMHQRAVAIEHNTRAQREWEEKVNQRIRELEKEELESAPAGQPARSRAD